MFCSKCGSKIADGAKFCSVCGARAVPTGLESATEHSVNKTQYSSERNTAPKPSRGFSLDLDWNDVEEQPSKKTGNLDFDWSSVIEERKPKKTTNKKIRSPWEDSSDAYEMNPGMPHTSSYRAPKRSTSLEEELFGKEEPSRDRSRTMNFIDVLKQEKDQQAREEYEKLRSESPRRSSISPTAHPAGRETVLPEEQREHTQGYTDLKDDIFAGLEKDEPKELSFEDQLANIRAERKEAQRKAESRRVAPIEDHSSSEDAFEEMLRGMKHGFEEEPVKAASPRRSEPTVEDRFRDSMPSGDSNRGRNTMFREYQDSFESIDDYDDVQLKNLEDDIHSSDNISDDVQDEPNFFFGEDKEPILNTQELDDESELDVDLFGEVPTAATAIDSAGDSVEDEYAEFDEYLDYMTPRRSSRTSRAARAQEEEAFDDEDDDLYDSFDAAMEAEDKAQKESKKTSIAAEAPEEPVGMETATVTAEAPAESKDAVDDEIAALQKQLEMLMKQKTGAPAAEETTEAEATPAVEETPAETLAEEAPEPAAVPAVEEHATEAVPEFVAENLEVAQDSTESLIEEKVPENSDVQETETVSDDTFASDDQLDLDKELAQLGFYLGETSSQPEAEVKTEEPLFNAESMDVGGNGTDTVVLSPEDLSKSVSEDEDFMSLEKMESDIFGNSPDENDLEATRKIDKFYTLYRKNEEFQKLLDEEYNKLQGGDIEDDVQDSIDAILGQSEIPAPAESVASPQQEQPPVTEASAFSAQPTLSQTQAPAVNDASLAAAATEAAVKDSRKKVKKKKAESEEYSGKGGSVLTVIAIVVAVLLVVLLAIILILNFAPESGIAQSLNEIIGNYTNFFADAGSDSLL